MRLNVITGAFVIFTILLCFALAVQLANRPGSREIAVPKNGDILRPIERVPVKVRREYAVRTATIIGGIVIGISACFVCSIVILRRARAEYRAQAMHNMEDLIKSTLVSHQKQDDA